MSIRLGYIPNINPQGLVVSEKKIFLCFPYISLCKICDCQGHNLNKLGKGPLGDAAILISRLLALWFQTRRFFHVFPYISLIQNM